MGIVISNLRAIEEDLLARGYRRRAYRHGYLGVRVLVKDEKAILIIPSIEVGDRFNQPLPEAIDESFKKLAAYLEKMSKRMTVTDIVFGGGGSIPIPDWFVQLCSAMKIRLTISSLDQPVRVADLGR